MLLCQEKSPGIEHWCLTVSSLSSFTVTSHLLLARLWHQILLDLADCFFPPLIFHVSDYQCSKSTGCVLFMVFSLTGGWMDKKERHTFFSSNHVGKTDIKAPLLNLMAE